MQRCFEQHLVLMTLMTPKFYSVYEDNSLQLAVEFILKTGQEYLASNGAAIKKYR